MGSVLVGVTAVSAREVALIGACLAYAAVSCVAFAKVEPLQRSKAAWVADALGGFALIIASETWRSPFYLLAVTALVLPATTLPFRRAIVWEGPSASSTSLWASSPRLRPTRSRARCAWRR